jgi:hypothetical protein
MRIASMSLVTMLAVAPALVAAGEQTCKGPLTRSETDFVFLAGGAQVHDQKTGLIWARCLEAQTWNGTTCTADDPKAVNPGPRITFDQAQKLAVSRRSTEEAWRLPTKAELLSLREPNCYNPSMSLRLFPTQPAWSSDGSFWTSSHEGKGFSVVDAIGNSDGWSTAEPSKTRHVRLVRTVPKDKP